MLEQGLTKEHWFNAAQFTASICRAIVRQGAGRKCLISPEKGAEKSLSAAQWCQRWRRVFSDHRLSPEVQSQEPRSWTRYNPQNQPIFSETAEQLEVYCIPAVITKQTFCDWLGKFSNIYYGSMHHYISPWTVFNRWHWPCLLVWQISDGIGSAWLNS